MKKVGKILLLIIVILIAGCTIIVSSMRLTLDEIKAQLDEQMQQHIQYFDERYETQGTVCVFDYSDVSIAWHPFEYEQGHLSMSGRVVGEIDVVISSPAAYQYLEKENGVYTSEDVRYLDVMKLTLKNGTDDYYEKGLELDHYSCFVTIGDMVFLDSKGDIYKAVHISDSDCILAKNGETVFERSPASGSGWKSGNGSCYWCNGTGGVKYNYGNSDLEAILSGYAPFEYGICGSCGGSGKD